MENKTADVVGVEPKVAEKEGDVMKYETVLPEDFNGIFKFTNFSDDDFTAIWGGKEYTFPANTTSPIIIPDQSPLEIQNIRKKFAKTLAEREFFKSTEYGILRKQEKNDDGTPKVNSIHQAATYSETTLAPFIKRCLTPMETSTAKVGTAPKEKLEDVLTVNESGEKNTTVLDKKTSLRNKALNA